MKRTFSTDIQVFGESLKGRCDILLRSTVLNLMQDLHDEQMPVETGWLRSSFMVTVNAPGVGTNPSTRPGKHDPGSTCHGHGLRCGYARVRDRP